MSTPHSVAAARGVSLFATALPGSSLCLLVCLRVLLAGVLLGFSDSGCSSGWIVAVSFPGLVFCQWAERPCACCPGLLAGCSCFLPGGRFPFCWLCLGLRVSSPSFHSPRPRSHSLSLGLSCSSLLPLGFYWLWVSVLATFVAWIVPCHLMVAYLLVSLRFFPVLFRSLFPTGWGPALLLRWMSFQSVLLVYLGRSLLFLALSSSFCQVLVHCLLSSLWLGWCSAPFLAPGISLFGLLAVPPFLLSRFVAVCFPGLWVSLFPGSFLVLGSSFPVLVFYSFLLCGTRGGIWFLPSAPLGCFILLSLTSGLLFLFLATAFPTVQLVPRFLSYFSDLVFCSSQSCLGLQWFWSSCPFRCWGSRLPLPIAVFRISSRGLCSFLFPDFVPGWFVLRLLRWYSAVSSCFPAFSRLADPCYFYSPALSLCCILGGSALHVFLLLAFGPIGWLFILSPSPWSTLCFCWSVPTLPSCFVGPPGSPRLALPLCSGVLLPGCTCSVSSVCIDSASFLSCSSGVLRPGGCFSWLVSSSMVVFVHSSHVRPLWSCALLPVSSLTSPPWPWLCCFLRLRFVRRLSLSVVFLVPSR